MSKKDPYITRVKRVRPDGRKEDYFWVRFERGSGVLKHLEAHKCFPCKAWGGVMKAKIAAREWRDEKLRGGIREYARLDQVG